MDWAEQNRYKYKILNLNYSYNNSNYHTKNKDDATEEVLIINY